MGYVMEKLQKYVRLIFNILKCWFYVFMFVSYVYVPDVEIYQV